MKIGDTKGAVIRLGVIAGVGAIAAIQPYRPIVVMGNSMSPTYMSGAIALSTPAGEDIHRGDIVVLQAEGSTMVKRVAFVPGDSIPQIKLCVGWTEVLDCIDPARLKALMKSRLRFEKVPNDAFYVLGDNRVDSLDSREYGFVSREQILRVVVNPKPFVSSGFQGPPGLRRLIAQR